MDARAPTRAALARIARLDPGLRSMVHVDEAAALREASDRADALARGEAPGVLHGVPLAIKDVLDVAGMPTRANSRLFAEAGPALRDSAVVARLRAAGAVIVGKAHCWELSVGGPSTEPPCPPARNPWDPAREPGGSSSGPGAAVGAALVPVAIGGDTGGSIRLPASACGVVGFKPSHGLVPMDGALPFAASLDVVGPLVRDARDAALVHGVISGTGIQAHAPTRGLRIGIPVALLDRAPPAPDMAARLEDCIAALRRAGHAVEPVVLPAAELFNACYFLVARTEAHARWRDALRGTGERMGSIARRSLAIGTFIDAEDAARAARVRTALRAGFDALFARIDLLCLPTMPGEAGPLDPGDAVTRPDTAPYTRPFSLVGAPAISMPCGRGTGGLPLGVQFVGARGADARLLAFACALEEDPAWPWRAELPEGFAWN